MSYLSVLPIDSVCLRIDFLSEEFPRSRPSESRTSLGRESPANWGWAEWKLISSTFLFLNGLSFPPCSVGYFFSIVYFFISSLALFIGL